MRAALNLMLSGACPLLFGARKATHLWLRVAHPTRIDLRLKSALPKRWPESPETLGEHLRCRCMQDGLLQRQVAKLIGANEWTYLSWETDTKKPAIRWPRILRFLGYDPIGEPVTGGDRIEALRRRQGWSHTRLAKELRLDLETVTKWARGSWRPLLRPQLFHSFSTASRSLISAPINFLRL